MAKFWMRSLVFGLVVAAVTAISEKCNIPDEDWEELASQFLAKMPAEQAFPRNESHARKVSEMLPGFTFGDITLSGLSNLKRYGPVKVYCKEGKPHVSVSMEAESPLKTSIPWKHCGGKSGTVGTQANVVKLCIGFDVEEVDGKVALRPSRVSPKWIDSVDVHLDGAGYMMKKAASVMGKLLTPFVKDCWIEHLPKKLHKMLEGLPN
ncbi:uncharacterized protein LOC144148858 [Haemaphysalis longicornis]